MYWLQKAATKDISDKYVSTAQSFLAGRYWDGIGVAPDKKKAISLYFRAVKNGNPRAQNAVAGLYYKGQFVKKDIIQALKWTLIFAANGNKKSQNSLNALKSRVTGQQMAKARDQAMALFPSIKLPSTKQSKIIVDIPEGWKHAYTGPKGVLVEYLPKDQTLTNWTDMISVVTYPRSVNIDRMYQHHLRGWKKRCRRLVPNRDPKIKTKSKFSSGYLLVICDDLAKPKPPTNIYSLDKEVLWIQFFQTRDKSFEVQRAYHHRKEIASKKELADRLTKRFVVWSKFFKSIKICDAMEPKEAC